MSLFDHGEGATTRFYPTGDLFVVSPPFCWGVKAGLLEGRSRRRQIGKKKKREEEGTELELLARFCLAWFVGACFALLALMGQFSISSLLSPLPCPVSAFFAGRVSRELTLWRKRIRQGRRRRISDDTAGEHQGRWRREREIDSREKREERVSATTS